MITSDFAVITSTKCDSSPLCSFSIRITDSRHWQELFGELGLLNQGGVPNTKSEHLYQKCWF